MSRALLRNLQGDERGVTAVEFGLLAMPLCVSMLGLLDLGYMMYARSVLQGVLNDVARQATVEAPVLGATGATVDQQIDAALRARMQNLTRAGTYTITKSSYYQFSRVGQPEKLVTDLNGNGAYNQGDCWQDSNPNGSYDTDGGRSGIGGADDIVNYQVVMAMPRIMPMAGLIGLSPNYAIKVKTSVRNQPYANQSAPTVVC